MAQDYRYNDLQAAMTAAIAQLAKPRGILPSEVAKEIASLWVEQHASVQAFQKEPGARMTFPPAAAVKHASGIAKRLGIVLSESFVDELKAQFPQAVQTRAIALREAAAEAAPLRGFANAAELWKRISKETRQKQARVKERAVAKRAEAAAIEALGSKYG